MASSDREARCKRSESAVEYTAHEPGYSLFFQNKALSPFNLKMKMSAIFLRGEAKSVLHSKVNLAKVSLDLLLWSEEKFDHYRRF